MHGLEGGESRVALSYPYIRQLGDRPVFVLTAMKPYSAQDIADWEITAEQAKGRA
jgi:hypothetical protein